VVMYSGIGIGVGCVVTKMKTNGWCVQYQRYQQRGERENGVLYRSS
jgi:hypothetical protein